MTLKGSEEKLAGELQAKMKTAETYESAWAMFAAIIIAHLIENAVVTGSTPNGGPLADGKVG